MKPDKSITITDASIKQVSIEVKVIKIDNKQMTLAVFRQLPEEPILNDLTGELRGQPWGRVNYCPDCKDVVPHFHIVWQKDNTLCRATIEKRWSGGPHKALRDELLYGKSNPWVTLHYYMESYLYVRSLKGWQPEELGKNINVKVEEHTFTINPEDISTHIMDLWKAEGVRRRQQEAVHGWEQLTKANPGDEYFQRTRDGERKRHTELEQEVDTHHKQAIDILNKEELPHDPAVLYRDRLIPAYKDYLHYIQQWKTSYAQLEALDQLFIAV